MQARGAAQSLLNWTMTVEGDLNESTSQKEMSTKEILKLSNESIWVVSQPGEGAAFTFTVQLAQTKRGNINDET